MLISKYLLLMHDAVDGRLSLSEFSEANMEKFSDETNPFPEPIYEVLNSLFLDSDEFEPDQALYDSIKPEKPQFIINETEYMNRIRKARTDLCNQDC